MQKIKCSKRYEEKNLIIIEGKYPSSLACVPHSHPHLYPGWCSLEHCRGCCIHAHWILREEGGWEKTYERHLNKTEEWRVLEEMTLKRSQPAAEGREKNADQRTFRLEGPVV